MDAIAALFAFQPFRGRAWRDDRLSADEERTLYGCAPTTVQSAGARDERAPGATRSWVPAGAARALVATAVRAIAAHA
jgi:hypothetical protein